MRSPGSNTQLSVEGYPGTSALLRSVAEGETGHAHGHHESADNLRSAVAGETYEYTQMYPDFAKTACEEGFAEVG